MKHHHPWKLRDTQACRKPHRCADCRRGIPAGDPCVETIEILDRSVRSVYFCRPCGR